MDKISGKKYMKKVFNSILRILSGISGGSDYPVNGISGDYCICLLMKYILITRKQLLFLIYRQHFFFIF